MILTCPSCDTQYFADDNTIGDSGRSVKCAACGHAWHVHGSGGVTSDAPTAVAGGAHEAYRERVRERRERRSRFVASMVWVISAIVFAALGASAVIFRNDVVRVWPQAAHAYKAAGLEVNRFGLDFNSIEPTRTFDGTTPVLTVTGTVINISSISQPAADVRISLRDENMQEVAVLVAPINQQTLKAGQEANFSARLENPPVAAFDLQLSFVDAAGDTTAGQRGGRVDAAETATETEAGAEPAAEDEGTSE